MSGFCAQGRVAYSPQKRHSELLLEDTFGHESVVRIWQHTEAKIFMPIKNKIAFKAILMTLKYIHAGARAL